MKFATIAATVLVASSVLASAGVVSADGIGTKVDDNNYKAQGTASVNVVKGDDAQFTVDQVPGFGTTDNGEGKTVANDLDFGTVTLSQLANAQQPMTAQLNKGAFAVTNTMGIQSWKLTATMDSFKNETANDDFAGTLVINNVPLTPGKEAQLYSSDNEDGFKAAGDNGSKSKWISPATDASMIVPTDAKLGNYTADITYKLTAGVSGNAASSTDATAQPATDNK
ncbi:hypothetical protein ACDP95_08420 [Weissella confusa]